MAKLEIAVKHEVGLHARPAASFVKIASSYPCDVTVANLTTGSDPVNAKSILGILSLGVNQGHRIEINADGDQADEALASLNTLIEDNFSE